MPRFLPSGLPARTVLTLLAMVLLAPVVLFSAALLIRISATERDRFGDRMLEAARRSALALDRDIANYEIALNTLSFSGSIESNPQVFHDRAVSVSHLLGTDIVMRTPDSQQVVNTALPWGTPLPVGRDLVTDQLVLQVRHALVSDLLRGQVSGKLLVNVTVPVLREGEIRYLLSLSVPPPKFAELIAAQTIPRGWQLAIVDRAGHTVSQGPVIAGDADQPVPDAGEFATLANRPGDGLWTDRSRDGKPIFVASARSAVTGYRLLIVAPQRLEAALLRHSLRLLVLFGCVAAISSILVGLRLGWLISHPLQQLAAAGRALGGHGTVPQIRTPIVEIGALAESLHAVSGELRDRAAERDHVEGQLRELAATLESRVVQRTAELSAANAALTDQIAQRENAESQLRQLQKMEAVGQLTGGIAHDFNNMLAVVMSSLTLAQRRMARGDTEIGSFIGMALDGAERAANLTRRLLAFSRQQKLAPAVIDANALITGMSDLLHRTLGETIRIETHLTEAPWTVHADASQLENALLNLAVNARDAMEAGGTLTLCTENHPIDPAAARDIGMAAGDYVLLSVRDSGAGMPADVLARAFDPFFTTKAVGKGTGLGLSQVYGFVRQSGGQVRIQSQPGQGTVIRIYLPRHDRATDIAAGDAVPAAIPAGRPHETLLVVEDDARVRELSTVALRELGYATLHAASGAAALELLEQHPAIALLFTDVVMPDMDGVALAEQAKRRYPALRVLFTTGFARDQVITLNAEPDAPLLAKPYRIEDLAQKIRAVLDEPAR